MGHGEPAPMGLDVAHPPIDGCHDLIALNTFKFFLQIQHLGGICPRLVLEMSLKNNSVASANVWRRDWTDVVTSSSIAR